MMRKLKGAIHVFCVAACLFVILNVSTVRAGESAVEQEINRALRGREYDRAVALIEKALSSATPDSREFLLYRQGLSLQYSGKLSDAIAVFERQISEFPAGAWTIKARMHIADAHFALKQFVEAEKIYAARIAELVSEGRKGEIAKVYLEFADEYFKPKDSLLQPNYERAQTFYEKSLELEPTGSLRETLLFKRALCNQKLGRHGPAADQFEAYLLEFDPAFREARRLRTGEQPMPGKADGGGAHWIDARLGLGESKLFLNDRLEARRVLQDLLSGLESANGGTPADKTAVGRRDDAWIKAKLLIARTFQIPTPPDSISLHSGVKVLNELIDRFPASAEAVTAAFDVGVAYRNQGRTDDAIAAFRSLINRDRIRPEESNIVKSAEALSQSALFQVGQLLLSQRKYADAIGAWNQYIAKYPNGPQWASSQQAIIDAEYGIGADAQADERFDDARGAWARFIEKYPLDPRASGILFAFGEMAFREQMKRKDAGDVPDWNIPIQAWKRLVEKNPGTEDAGRAQYRIGQTLEENVFDLDGAITAYQKLNWSAMAPLAAQRLSAMRSVSMELRTDRAYRADEKPVVHVDVRNIDRLTVKMYRIDMEEYFRKGRSLNGVEGLDLILIDPDETFDVEVRDYAPYRPIAQTIEIPCKVPGAWAVYVSNEKSAAQDKGAPAGLAADRPTRLQATTLVLVSDIDVLVQSSRGQVLVYVQDMRQMKPMRGVKLLIADQSSVILEGQTDEGGFFASTDAKLKNAGRLSVFAKVGGSAGAHVAGTALGLEGLSFSQGLRPRGYIYTDRPAYRPGDSVNIRGILREVAGGAYSLPAQPEDKRLRWKIEIVDAKGRTLRADEIALTEYGTFSSLFQIADDAPVGNYRIIVRRVDGPAFEGGFGVETYRLTTAFIAFDIARPVVLRGERVTGDILVRYHYGEPVIDKEVEYELHFPNGDVERRAGRTDKTGKIAIEFETASLPEDGQVQLVARQADMNLMAADTVFVAVRDFTAGVSTLRSLYLSEEPVEVRVETRDLKGGPTARKMTVTAYRRTYEKGMWSESRAESAEVATDAGTGVGRASLKLAKGGIYIIRAEGRDTRGELVAAEASLTVSDAEDTTRLRLFSDRENYRVGDRIALDVHSRIEPIRRSRIGESGGVERGDSSAPEALAVLMSEGDGVFQYRTVTIRPGHNAIDLTVENVHFPNFKLIAAVMTGGKLHIATREFTVERELSVKIKPRQLTARPRDEMSVDIVVTDQQGKPVQGEFSVAMVDAALLAQYADRSPPIVPFFQSDARRSTDSRTQSSCTFLYRPATTAMVTEVLDFDAELAEADDEKDYSRAMRRIAESWKPGEAAPPASPAPTAGGVDLALILGRDGAVESEGAGGDANAQPAVKRRSGSAGVASLFGGVSARPMKDEVSQMAAQFRPESKDDEFGDMGVAPMVRAGLADLPDREAYKQQLQRRLFESCQSWIRSGQMDNRAIDERLGEAVRATPFRTYYPEVAYWNPQVVTDSEGKATVTIVLPDSSTTWKLIARGTTRDTIVGEASAEVVSKNDFLVEWNAPAMLIEGDRFVPRGQVHCLTPFAGRIKVQFEARRSNGEPIASGEKVMDVESSGVFDVEFDAIEVPASELVALTLSAVAVAKNQDAGSGARELSDSLKVEIPVQTWGLRIESQQAGIVKDTEFVEIELPQLEDMKHAYHDMRLVVAVGSSMQRWLVEEALEMGGRWNRIDVGMKRWRVTPPRTHADTASVLLGTLYAGDYLASNAAAQDPRLTSDRVLLDERVAGLIAQLLASQNDDGGWPWCGSVGESNPWVSAAVAWSLGKAKYNGYAPATDAVARLSAYLQKSFADAAVNQAELKTVVLHGLAWIDDIDFGHVNRLYRNRESLGSAGLAHLALIFAKLDRGTMAAEVLELLARKSSITNRKNVRICEVRCTDNSAWMRSELEVTALTLLAQLQVDPRNDRVASMVAYLAGAARADGWRPHKAKGPVIAALATYYLRGERDRENFRMGLSVNGKPVGEVTSDTPESLVFQFSSDELAAGRQRVDFSFAGRGECAYSVTLSGFRACYPTAVEARNEIVYVNPREIDPPSMEYRGRQVRRGFGVAARYDSFTNVAKHVPVGTVVSARTSFGRMDTQRGDAADRDYLIVKEVIPAGFRLLTDTLSGSYASYDVRDNVLTLYYGNVADLGQIYYKMVAVTPGTYRLPPTILRSLYRPEVYHLNRDDQTLTVLPRGAKSPDEYQLSPDELYEFGRFHFDDGDFAAASEYLKKLVAGAWTLRDEPYRQSVRMLLTCALQIGDNEAIVNYFEILKEKFGDLVISFSEIVRVAKAYAATGQQERACVIHRATADSTFIAETAVGGVLQAEGRFLDGHDFLVRLWRDYPDTPEVQSTFFAASQVLYSRAATAASLSPRRTAEGAARRVTRLSIMAETIRMLETFVTLYPDSPAVDEASYSLVNAYLDLDDFKTVISRTEELIRLFPQSKWLDRFRYMQALAYFNLGEFDKALTLAIQVSESTFVDDQGVTRPSPNKSLALYIAGQIFHAQSKIEKAIEYYKKVGSQFSDASEAVEFFEHKFIRLPEVTIFHPDDKVFRESVALERLFSVANLPRGQRPTQQNSPQREYNESVSMKPFVRVSYRNVKDAVVQVYRVDLMKLALVEKNLNQIASVNLAGIKPIIEETVQLNDDKTYLDKQQRVPLDLAGRKDGADSVEGAYLVICRSGDFYSSGLVLITPLAVEVQEDPAGGRARVNVVDALTRGGEKSVHVKVIGTGMTRFVSGETDLRGMFIADDIRGAVTAIARDTNGHFAFYRSESILAERLARQPNEKGSIGRKETAGSSKANYRGNLDLDNCRMQELNSQWLEGRFQQQGRGVAVQKAQ
ncbi:MAG: tetratricopeptide repeat protein [Phycisphaerae bacterium]|nr:tetratricopeptide repeat protein [Phycisphaerae bacterium]